MTRLNAVNLSISSPPQKKKKKNSLSVCNVSRDERGYWSNQQRSVCRKCANKCVCNCVDTLYINVKRILILPLLKSRWLLTVCVKVADVDRASDERQLSWTRQAQTGLDWPPCLRQEIQEQSVTELSSVTLTSRASKCEVNQIYQGHNLFMFIIISMQSIQL